MPKIMRIVYKHTYKMVAVNFLIMQRSDVQKATLLEERIHSSIHLSMVPTQVPSSIVS